jgi:very-short-patch-repair endonuclease
VKKVVELIENSPGRRTKPLRALIAEATDAPDTKSEFEDRFTDFLRERPDLPTPHRNTLVLGYEVDAHFPGTGLIIELDSRAWHWNRREEDVDRDAELHLARYLVYRVTWRALTRTPHVVEARIKQFLEQTRGVRAAA